MGIIFRMATFTSTTDFTASADWDLLRALLPADREASAYAYGALLRKRKDGIADADTLLRLMFGYTCAQSLRSTAAWAAEADLAHVADTALLYRFKNCGGWLKHLLGQLLLPAPGTLPPATIRLVDASTITGVGPHASNWRVHLGFDLRTYRMQDLLLTPDSIGESLRWQTYAPDEIAIVDRGYATRENISAIHAAHAHIVVRLNWQNVPLQTRTGAAFDLMAALRTLAYGATGSWDVQTAPTTKLPAVRGRLVIEHLPEPEAKAARSKRERTLRKEARKRPHGIDPRTWESSEYLILFTTLPASVSAAQVVALYRFRWQIELVFKRLKSLLHLDALPAKTTALARSWLYAKLLIAVLVDRLAHAGQAFPPSAPGATPRELVARDPLALPGGRPGHFGGDSPGNPLVDPAGRHTVLFHGCPPTPAETIR
jgi:hypothetical protein